LASKLLATDPQQNWRVRCGSYESYGSKLGGASKHFCKQRR
jgi:hypothetical protein